jgi:hypothetical protein
MFNPPLLADVKARLADVPHIDEMSLTMLAGRMMFGIHGFVVGLDPGATDDEIDAAIRRALGDKQVHTTNPIAAAAVAALEPEIPLANVVPPPVTMTITPEPKPMTTPAPGSFAASLKAMMDEAVAGVEQAKADGLSKVRKAVVKLGDAKAATVRVTDSLAANIENQAASVLSELGQISNDLTGEA